MSPKTEVLTTREAARLIGISPQQLRYLIRQGRVRHRELPRTDGEGRVVGKEYAITFAEAKRVRDTPRRKLKELPNA